jgi:hypothetical protein
MIFEVIECEPRIGRRMIMTMVLIVAFTPVWNLLCHQSPRSALC